MTGRSGNISDDSIVVGMECLNEIALWDESL